MVQANSTNNTCYIALQTEIHQQIESKDYSMNKLEHIFYDEDVCGVIVHIYIIAYFVLLFRKLSMLYFAMATLPTDKQY